jgi:hypothetical protein
MMSPVYLRSLPELERRGNLTAESEAARNHLAGVVISPHVHVSSRREIAFLPSLVIGLVAMPETKSCKASSLKHLAQTNSKSTLPKGMRSHHKRRGHLTIKR